MFTLNNYKFVVTPFEKQEFIIKFFVLKNIAQDTGM